MRSVVPVPEERVVGSSRYWVAVLPRCVVCEAPKGHAVNLVTLLVENLEKLGHKFKQDIENEPAATAEKARKAGFDIDFEDIFEKP